MVNKQKSEDKPDKYPPMIINKEIGDRIAISLERVNLGFTEFIAVIAGIFVAFGPPVILPVVLGFQSYGWKWFTIAAYLISWVLMVFAILTGFLYYGWYGRALFFNPHHYYGHYQNERQGERVEVSEDKVYSTHRDFNEELRKIHILEVAFFMFGAMFFLISMLLLSIAAIAGL